MAALASRTHHSQPQLGAAGLGAAGAHSDSAGPGWLVPSSSPALGACHSLGGSGPSKQPPSQRFLKGRGHAAVPPPAAGVRPAADHRLIPALAPPCDKSDTRPPSGQGLPFRGPRCKPAHIDELVGEDGPGSPWVPGGDSIWTPPHTPGSEEPLVPSPLGSAPSVLGRQIHVLLSRPPTVLRLASHGDGLLREGTVDTQLWPMVELSRGVAGDRVRLLLISHRKRIQDRTEAQVVPRGVHLRWGHKPAQMTLVPLSPFPFRTHSLAGKWGTMRKLSGTKAPVPEPPLRTSLPSPESSLMPAGQGLCCTDDKARQGLIHMPLS